MFYTIIYFYSESLPFTLLYETVGLSFFFENNGLYFTSCFTRATTIGNIILDEAVFEIQRDKNPVTDITPRRSLYFGQFKMRFSYFIYYHFGSDPKNIMIFNATLS